MTDNRVEVLCPGMIRRDGQIVLEARSSVSLVSCGERHLLVDTSGPQNRKLLLQALRSRGVAPDDIEIVVMTHLHHDHLGNIDLFPKAERYAHRLESPGPTYHAVDEDSEIWKGVRLMHTPGHTRGSMSVLVEGGERYGLVGDAIPTEDNARKWVPPEHHYDRDLAMESMSRLMGEVDIIVPGHGPSFRTADYRREKG
ncbi:MAG: MBL fold metallo-hydrolase [Methanomassiliicoccales archaeon]|nr:MBL fold metallo-hydrolase [Methanomassiliicoccales archaeon]